MGPQEPRLSSQAERERSAAKDKGTGGQYVAVCSVSNSPLTHNPFTFWQPFPIKCERYIFLKKCVHSSLLLILFLHVYVYGICIIRLYNTRMVYIYIAQQNDVLDLKLPLRKRSLTARSNIFERQLKFSINFFSYTVLTMFYFCCVSVICTQKSDHLYTHTHTHHR